MSEASTVCIAGQKSYRLHARCVDAALTVNGAHLAPVTFFPEEPNPIKPYAVAPWAEEALPRDTPPVIAHLRGDWFCSAFGANAESHRGTRLPLHGETANAPWHLVGRGVSSAGSWLRLAMEMPLQGGRCEATTALLDDQSVIYQRHDLSHLTGPINPGHHATLLFPDQEGAGRLSFSRFVCARTYVEPVESPENRGYSCLRPDFEIDDLRAVPCIDGSMTDISRYPLRRGFDDIVILCADPELDFAWSAVTFPEERFVWFSLRDPKQLASTLLWFSNGGRYYAPWNGRHVNVMGIEDVTGFFHVGLARSCLLNPLSRRGISTCIQPDDFQRLSIRYIQGVARIPDQFERVESISPTGRRDGILLQAPSGVPVEVRCQLQFLHTGRLPGLQIPDKY